MKLVIKGARIVNYDQTVDADILVKDGIIEKIGQVSEKCDKEIDASGKIVLPGFIDLHTHIRSPGQEDKEDFLTASRAAARGGFTTLFTMPNTIPPVDCESCARWIHDQGRAVGLVDIYPVGTITKGRAGKELSELCALKRAGCRAVSDDGDSVQDSSLMRKALEYSRMCDMLVVSHCEDRYLSGGGMMRESALSSQYGMRSIPSLSEILIVSRDLEMARYLDAPIHLAHISTARSVELIRKAKAENVRVSCETAPHYFTLTVNDIVQGGFDSKYKVNPPLGEDEDIQAIKKALKDGTIDCIATDHAPHLKGEKELPFRDAPFGFIGLEWSFSLSYTCLVKPGALDLPELVRKMSYNPAQIGKFSDRGYVKEGNRADLVVVDLNRSWTINEDEIESKSKNTPFIGYTLDAVIEYTIYQGAVTYKNA